LKDIRALAHQVKRWPFHCAGYAHEFSLSRAGSGKFVHRGSPEADLAERQQLERIRRTLVDGNHANLEDSPFQALALWLNAIEPQFMRFCATKFKSSWH
jgi:hypothetical protein